MWMDFGLALTLAHCPQSASRLTRLALQRPELLHHPKRELGVSEPVTLTDDLGVQQ